MTESLRRQVLAACQKALKLAFRGPGMPSEATVMQRVRGAYQLTFEENRITYAAGFRTAPDSYGMFAGPTTNLQELLEEEPPVDLLDAAYILEFEYVGDEADYLRTTPVYKWKDGRWQPRKLKK
jgi:hypothetical protein